MASYRTRAPKGVFIYGSHEEANRARDAWTVDAYPTLYLIDHAGVIRHVWEGDPGAEELDKAVEKMVAEAEKAKK